MEQRNTVLRGDCRELMRTLPAESVDAIVTDPPYELGFMGKSWDSAGVSFDPATWAEALRVLKPGGHLLAFGGSRTYHRIAVAIEDAGFEIRDTLMWLYGSGFPKSHDVSKAIDKKVGAEREVVGSKDVTRVYKGSSSLNTGTIRAAGSIDITAPATDAAKQWEGWGTALKPAHEPIVVARKPLIGTVAENVLAHGTGAINIGASRIGTEERTNAPAGNGKAARPSATTGASHGGTSGGFNYSPGAADSAVTGRWPANVLFDEVAAAQLGEPSRFFYVAKTGKRERNAGCKALPTVTGTVNGPAKHGYEKPVFSSKNHHPTVKPIALMRYLVRLVTPPGGVILDPFLGSGTTACAAVLEGFDYIGMEMTAEYADIAEARIAHWQAQGELDPAA